MGDDISKGEDLNPDKGFNELVLEYGPRIYSTVRGMVGTHETADDIVQETFLRAYRNQKSYRGEAEIGTWLTRIALNLVYSRSRRKKIFSFTSIDDYSDKIATDAPLPEDRIIEEERRNFVESTLGKLPNKQRAVFVLRMYEDKSFKEIASIMGTSESASRANFHQALNKLKKLASEIN